MPMFACNWRQMFLQFLQAIAQHPDRENVQRDMRFARLVFARGSGPAVVAVSGCFTGWRRREFEVKASHIELSCRTVILEFEPSLLISAYNLRTDVCRCKAILGYHSLYHDSSVELGRGVVVYQFTVRDWIIKVGAPQLAPDLEPKHESPNPPKDPKPITPSAVCDTHIVPTTSIIKAYILCRHFSYSQSSTLLSISFATGVL